MKSFKPFLLFMLCLSMFGCDFRPERMTIEYDEEVKLHDGSMIWVHITRHYGLVGGVPSGHGKSYMPGAVDISWDTGFEGVGRKSLVFQGQIYVLDKINEEWYIYGSTSRNIFNPNQNAIVCNNVGTLYFNHSNCLVRLNSYGEFLQSDKNSLYQLDKGNILYSYSIKDWGLVPQELNSKKLTWAEKLNLQNFQPQEDRNIDVILFEGNIK